MAPDFKKQAVLALCIALFILSLPAAVLVLYVDPFQIYHKPTIAGMKLNGNQRYQNAGLINNYLADPAESFDSVIIGTSMSANNDANSVARIFGWQKPLRLTVIGGIPEEHAGVLKHALATGRVKHVLWEIHPFFYQDSYYRRGAHDASSDYYFPTRLYNETPWDDWAYLFNIDTLKLSWQLLRGDLHTNQDTLESIGVWASVAEEEKTHADLNSAESIQSLKTEKRHEIGGWSEEEINGIVYPALDEQVYPILKQYCNTDVEFVLQVPPWPKFRYLRNSNTANRAVYMMRHILREINGCKNMRLHNFDLLDVTLDLNFFADNQHFRPQFSGYLLEKMAKKDNVLTLDNVRDYETRFIEQLNYYEVHSSWPKPLKL